MKLYQVLRVWPEGFGRIGGYWRKQEDAFDCAVEAAKHEGCECVIAAVDLSGDPWPIITAESERSLREGGLTTGVREGG